MCGKGEFKPVINFGQSPLQNSLLSADELSKPEFTRLLQVFQCQQCFLVQIINPVSGERIYQEQDYLYFTGEMPTTEAYFQDFVWELERRFVRDGDFVVEIGSNDGTMIKRFKKRIIPLGVDPATNVVIRALARGVPTLNGFFTERNAKKIRNEWGDAKLVGGANCIAHLADLQDMMRGVMALLSHDGVFWVECNYWGAMVKNKNYALIYHDHFSYFSLFVWQQFLRTYGLEVFDATVTPAQGGSLRFFAARPGIYETTERFYEILREEENTHLNTAEVCEKYEKDVKEEAFRLKKLVSGIKHDEMKSIAGYGAAAKGLSVLHFAGIGAESISYFVDDSPAKQGKYTPIEHIAVISREEAQEKLPDYFFITAPNYADVIIEKEKNFRNRGGKFITVDGRIIS